MPAQPVHAPPADSAPGAVTRRRVLAGAAALAAASGLPGAQAQSAPPYALRAGKPLARTKINILAVVAPQIDGLMLRAGEFTALTGIETHWDFVPFSVLQEKVASIGVAADDRYDVVHYSDSWAAPNAHWFVRLDSRLKRDGIGMDRYPPAFARTAMFKDEVIGLPIRSHVQLFYYRRDIFGELGLPEPKTWDDVVAAGHAIRAKRPGIEPLALNFHNDGTRLNIQHWLQFVWAAGGQMFDERMRPAWNTEAGLRASEYYIGLLTKERVANPRSVAFDQNDMRLSFQQGNSAMMPMWWWAYSPAISPTESVLKPAQVGFTGVPSYQGRATALAISLPFSISSYSKRQDAAWEFLKWLSNPDLDKVNAIERQVAGKNTANNVVNHSVNLRDPEVNAANADVPMAGWQSLQQADVLPKIVEWPEVGDQIAYAIADAAAGGDVRRLMNQAAAKSTEILRQAGHFR